MNIEQLRRLEQERFERRLSQKSKKKIKNRKRSGFVAYAKHRIAYKANVKTKSTAQWFDIEAPKNLNLLDLRGPTVSFFNDVRSSVRLGRRVRIDFQHTVHISPEALIYLLAQVHKLRIEFGIEYITGTYPANNKIERLLEESGFFNVLMVKKRGVVLRRSRNTRYLKFKSDTKVNAQEIPNLRDELLDNDLKMPSSFGRKVYRALSEAMINVHHHAYHQKSLRNHNLKGRWWLSAQLSVKTNLFTLTFYDAGVGIPKTLPRRYPVELIRRALSMLSIIDPDDAEMIKAAIVLGRTRTNADNRGKGLMDLLQLIDTVGGGSIWILSRNGSYRYGDCGEACVNHSEFVEGTLIKWDIPLDKAIVCLPEIENDETD